MFFRSEIEPTDPAPRWVGPNRIAAFIEDILDGTDDEHGLNVLFPPVARNGKTIRISFGPKTRTAIEKAKFNHEIRDAVLKHAVAPYITNTN